MQENPETTPDEGQTEPAEPAKETPAEKPAETETPAEPATPAE